MEELLYSKTQQAGDPSTSVLKPGCTGRRGFPFYSTRKDLLPLQELQDGSICDIGDRVRLRQGVLEHGPRPRASIVAQRSAADFLTCILPPLLQELMADPVMVATGHTYDRVCIERWLAQGNRTCPVTGMRLRHLELTPNFALRNAIQVPSCLLLMRPPPSNASVWPYPRVC